jgi:hypothetical protein
MCHSQGLIHSITLSYRYVLCFLLHNLLTSLKKFWYTVVCHLYYSCGSQIGHHTLSTDKLKQ